MGAQQYVAHIHWHDTPGIMGGDQTDMPANAFIVCEDVDLSQGAPRRLGGRALIGTTSVAASSGIRAGYDWDRDGSSQQDIVLTSSGTVWMETASGSGSYTALVTGLTGFASNTAYHPCFVEGGNEVTGAERKLFLFSGINPAYVLTGTGNTMATLTYPPGDWTGTDYPIFGTVHDSRLWAGGVRASPHRIYYSDDEDHEKFTTAIFRDSARFDGTAYLAKGTDLTGNANGKKGLVSMWLKMKDGTNGQTMSIVNTANGNFIIRRTNQDKIQIQGLGTTATAVLKLTSDSSINSNDGWFHVMASWDLSVSDVDMYINGQVDLACGSIIVNADIDYTDTAHYIGNNAAAGQAFNGRMSQMYLNYAEYLNLSFTGNRNLLYDSLDNGARGLASDASDVTGTAPIVYLNNTATNFETNLGGGGNYTETAGVLISSPNVAPGNRGGDPGSFNVFPGLGSLLVAAVSLKGFLVCFKQPRGIFAVNTQSTDVTQWQQQILSHNIGIAYPKAFVVAEGELIFMSSDGDFHAVSIIQNDEQSEASITKVTRFDQWVDKNLSKASLPLGLNTAVYDASRKRAMFHWNSYGHSNGAAIMCVDLNKESPRFQVMDTTSIQSRASVWLSRDGNNIPRPVVGSTSNGQYYFYPSATTYNIETAAGGGAANWPTFNIRTPNMDFKEVDQALRDVRKNGRWLEIVYEPCTGTVTLAAEIFWDGNSTATITFPISASTGIGYARRRLDGAGRTFGVRLYHPTPSTTTHAFAISNLNVYFVPGAQSPT